MPRPQPDLWASRRLAEVHRAAQERLGLMASATVLAEWDSVNPVKAGGRSSGFVMRLLRLMLGLRRASRTLSATYYRLHRAIDTGESMPSLPDEKPFGSEVPLRTLYASFEASVRDAVSLRPPQSGRLRQLINSTPAREAAVGGDRMARVDGLDEALAALEPLFNTGSVPVDGAATWPSLEEDETFPDEFEALLRERLQGLQDEADRLAREAASETARFLDEVDAASENAAFEVASTADVAAIQPGRDFIELVGSQDRLILGWMRCTAAHPCAFCAMLASRGAVYLSGSTALATAGGKGGKATAAQRRRSAQGRQRRQSTQMPPGLNYYHPNCHCYVIPVFKTNPAYSARDRFFMDMWKEHGSGQKDPLNAWRRWLTQAYREGLVPDQDVYGPAR